MKKQWTNQEVAELLRAVAAAYEVRNASKFKVIAYDRAATSVEHLTTEIKDLWDEGKINEIPGVGPSIAQHLDELFAKGQSSHFREVMKGLPPAMFELIKISGIGPKTAFKLCQSLKIWRKKGALERIKKAAEEGKIRRLPGFGEESERKIKEAVTQAKLKKKEKPRMLLPYAAELAKKIIAYLKSSPWVEDAQPLGSLRRQCATIGDIDIAVKTKKPKKVVAFFLKFPQIKQVLNQGEKKASVVLHNETQVDLRTQDAQTWGSMLQYFTGSKHHNIALREWAQKRGFSLSEYGIKKVKTGKVIRTKTEEEFYRYLGLPWIPPELREDQGEIEAAQKNKLPKLVSIKDIKGDLHLHSDFDVEPSHDLGKDDMETMVKKAAQLGYQYLGFTEHNPSISQHTPQQIISILSRKKELVEKINRTCAKKLNIKVLNGLEVDILPDGRLALPEKAFALLDYVIASVHTSFHQPKKKMTQRILTALDFPKVRFLGHPTGRKLEMREGYEVDWEKVFAKVLKNGQFLEVNAFPDRLDLPDFLVKEAIQHGVKLVVNTDAHQVEHMELMPYGVAVARRGWARKKDIVNTLPWKKFAKAFKIYYN